MLPVANKILFSLVLLFLYVGSVLASRKIMKWVMKETKTGPDIFLLFLVLIPGANLGASILFYFNFCVQKISVDKLVKKFFGM
ncbi:hypothetical protein [Bacillus cereus]|uniref:hypothetical protein n=1 Tax=Bacillus cereus TaxID=1396 RepID=UPI003D950E16